MYFQNLCSFFLGLKHIHIQRTSLIYQVCILVYSTSQVWVGFLRDLQYWLVGGWLLDGGCLFVASQAFLLAALLVGVSSKFKTLRRYGCCSFLRMNELFFLSILIKFLHHHLVVVVVIVVAEIIGIISPFLSSSSSASSTAAAI